MKISVFKDKLFFDFCVAIKTLEFKPSINKLQIFYNFNYNISNNSKGGKNSNINYKYNNKIKINKFYKLTDKIHKDIEVILTNSKDYLEGKINSKSTINHKSNTQKSKSVNSYTNNFPSSEAIHITNSIIGLDNLGETCYMNSALQNIIHCKKFIEKLLPFKNNRSEQIITNSFLDVCYSLIENKYSRERNHTTSYYYSLNSFSFSPF